MGAQHCVRRELFDASGKPIARMARENALEPIQPPRQFWIIGLFEHDPPNLRRMLDQSYVTVGMNFSMQRGEELYEIDFLDDIVSSV